MNENLNLVEILKDCPEGTKFYHKLFGYVEIEEVIQAHNPHRCTEPNEPYIKIKVENIHGEKFIRYVTDNGRCKDFDDGECLLVPSKEQQDWEKFEVTWKKPKFDPKTLQPFDKVLARYNKSCRWKALFFSHCYVTQDNENIYVCDSAEYMHCIPFDDSTKHLVGTNEEAPEFYRYWEE